MDFKAYFDLDPQLTYLNSGSVSIAPRSVRLAVQRHQNNFELNPTAGLFGVWGRVWKAQKSLAEFFGARPNDLFLRANVSEALNVFLLGMPLASGGEILVSDLEYGAMVNVCRLRCERENRRLRVFRLPADPNVFAGLAVEDVVRMITDQLHSDTRLVLLSHVMTANGLVLPLADIARETRKRGVLLAVDGAHGPGALPLDFGKLDDVDFYGGNLHKWMMGPKGTGFGWVPSRHHDSLSDLIGGWTTFENPEPFKDFGEGDRFALRMLKSSSYDFAPILAIPEMLDFWEELGKEAIWRRKRELRNHTVKMMQKTGWPLCSPDDGPLAGPLLAFRLPPRLAELRFGLMTKLLIENRLQIVTNRFHDHWHVRISPHVYNDETDLDRAVEIFERLR